MPGKYTHCHLVGPLAAAALAFVVAFPPMAACLAPSATGVAVQEGHLPKVAAGEAVNLATVLAGDAPSSSDQVQISGFGYGHGRGMGQWGAFGYASEYGWSYQQVLAHFYEGTTLSTLPGAEPDVPVHLQELDGHNAIASALAGGSLVATWPSAAPAVAVGFEVVRSAGTQTVYSSAGCSGPWKAVGSTTGDVTITSAVPGTTDAAAPDASELQACLPDLAARTYQGELVAQPDGQTLNVVGLEDYVDGVVPAESPATWADEGGEAALEAQAVAARSYALAAVAATGEICDGTACQVYRGLPDQYGLTADTAVSATAGQVLYCDAGSTCGPAGSVALAEYSASTGGYTAGGAFPPVPDLGDSVASNPLHSWTVDVPVARFGSAFPGAGAYEAVDVTERNGLGLIGGRAEQVSVIGASGSVSVTGAQFAADLGLPSDWFEVAATGATGPPTPGTTPATPPSATATGEPSAVPTPGGLGPDDGYWVVNRQGEVAAFGAAGYYGTAAGTRIAGKVVAMAATPDGHGYWLAGDNGGVLAFGDAHWYGSASDLHLHERVVAMAATPDGRGYWLASSDGSVFAYGDAGFYGSLGNFHLGEAIAGFAPTPDGRGYWMASTTGAVFAFGDAGFYGSAAAGYLARPIAGIVASNDGRGYLLVARDGGVFAFGDAAYLGSLPGERVRADVVAAAPTNDGSGYYVLAATGIVYAFGDATLPAVFSPAGSPLGKGAIAMACDRSWLG